MNIREQIISAVKMYCQKRYNAECFCDVFLQLYFYENSGYRLFDGAQRKMLDKLAYVAERYTSNADDIKNNPQYYVPEEIIQKVANEVILCVKTEGGLEDGGTVLLSSADKTDDGKTD